MLKHGNMTVQYMCKLCSLMYKLPQELRAHLERKHPELDKNERKKLMRYGKTMKYGSNGSSHNASPRRYWSASYAAQTALEKAQQEEKRQMPYGTSVSSYAHGAYVYPTVFPQTTPVPFSGISSQSDTQAPSTTSSSSISNSYAVTESPAASSVNTENLTQVSSSENGGSGRRKPALPLHRTEFLVYDSGSDSYVQTGGSRYSASSGGSSERVVHTSYYGGVTTSPSSVTDRTSTLTLTEATKSSSWGESAYHAHYQTSSKPSALKHIHACSHQKSYKVTPNCAYLHH